MSTTFIVSEILKNKKFVGYKLVPDKKLPTPPPPPTIPVGDADILFKPHLCCGNLANGNQCQKKGKYSTDLKTDKWYCGFHLSVDDRKFEYKKKHNPTVQQCSICFDDIDLKDDCTQTMCGHLFHTECLKDWNKLNQNCPNCRTGVFSKDSNVNNKLIYNMFLLKKAFGLNEIFSENIETYYHFKLKQSVRIQKELEFLKNCKLDMLANMIMKVVESINEHKELLEDY